MKEIEEKVKENSANIVMVSKKSKKAAAKNAASQSAADNTADEVEAAEASEPTAAIDIDIDADDDYEEFTPVDTD